MRRHRDEDAHGCYPGKKQRRRIASDDDEDEDEDEGKGSDDDDEEEEEEARFEQRTVFPSERVLCQLGRAGVEKFEREWAR